MIQFKSVTCYNDLEGKWGGGGQPIFLRNTWKVTGYRVLVPEGDAPSFPLDLQLTLGCDSGDVDARN